MKQGKSLTDLAAELQRVNASKRDYAAPLGAIQMGDNAELILADGNGGKGFGMRSWAHNQMAEYTSIPRGYYDRLRNENSALLARNVNHGFDINKHHNAKESRLVRTIDGQVRAFLSPRYRILDAHDLLEAVFPSMIEAGLDVESCELTEKRLYIKAFSKTLTGDVKVNDPVRYGINISTSDVGAGRLLIEPMLFRLVCSNGMIMADQSLKKFHIGRAIDAEELREVLSNEAKQKADEAFWLMTRDVVRNSLRPEVFAASLDKLRESSQLKLQNFDLPQVVEIAASHVGITNEWIKHSIVEHLAAGGDLTKWGLLNAFTRVANDTEDYEVATELERAGGKILELGPAAWKTISVKKAA